MANDAASYVFSSNNNQNLNVEYSLNIGSPVSSLPLSNGKPKLRDDVKKRLSNRFGPGALRSNHHTMSNSCDSSQIFDVHSLASNSDSKHHRTSSHGMVQSLNPNMNLSHPSSSSHHHHSQFVAPPPALGKSDSGRMVMHDVNPSSNASSALGAIHCPSSRFLFQPPTPMNGYNTPSVRYLIRKSDAAPKTITFGQQINEMIQEEAEEDEEEERDGHNEDCDDDQDIVDDEKDHESSYASVDMGRTMVGSHSRSGVRSSNHSVASHHSVASMHSVGTRRSTSNSRQSSRLSHSRSRQSVASQGSKSELEWMNDRSRTMNDADRITLPTINAMEHNHPMIAHKTRSRTMNTVLFNQSQIQSPLSPITSIHSINKSVASNLNSIPPPPAEPQLSFPPPPPLPPPLSIPPPPPPDLSEVGSSTTISGSNPIAPPFPTSTLSIEDYGPKYKEPTLASNAPVKVFTPPLFRLNPLFTDYEELKKAPSEKIQLDGIEFARDSQQTQGQQSKSSHSLRSSRIPRIEESKSAHDDKGSVAMEPDEKERKHADKRKQNEDWQILGDLLFSIRHSLISRKRQAAQEAVLEGGDSRRKRKSMQHLEATKTEWTTFNFEEYAAELFADLRCKWLRSKNPLSDNYVKKLFGSEDNGLPLEQLDINKSCKYYWRRLNTNSKSGQIFFQSVNGEYIMKSMPKSEAEFFRKSFLKDYHQHMLDEPDSLLMHIMGCYQIQYKTGHSSMSLASNNEYNAKRKQDVGKGVYVIVMKSILYCEMTPTVKMHKVYDLKGSTHNRKASRYRLELDPSTLDALKEIDSHSFEHEIDGVENLDSTVKRINYSYSAGFYQPDAGDKVKRDESCTGSMTGSVSTEMNHHATDSLNGKIVTYKRSRVLKDLDFIQDEERIDVGYKIKTKYCNQLRTDLDFLIKMNVMDYSLLVGIHRLDIERRSDDNNKSRSKPKRMKKGNLFTFEFGGMCAEKIMIDTEDSSNSTADRKNKKKNIYFTGIIDFLQKYNTKKMVESYYKRCKVTEGTKAISAVDSKTYANRLYEFIAKRID